MSKEVLENAINEGKIHCPKCKKPILKYDKFVDMISSIWDGFGDSKVEVQGTKVTLICANEPCSWRERTEYWEDLIQ